MANKSVENLLIFTLFYASAPPPSPKQSLCTL